VSTPATPQVYAAIAAVQAELAKTGIGKDRQNATQGFKFRGIDDVYNALAHLMAQKQLIVVPRMITRECTERQTQRGGVLYDVVVEAEYDFVSAVDGSKHTARTFGEAMDSGDKATNKAMSAAYKYAAIQTFCIPTEGDNDADATTHETTIGTVRRAPQKPPAPEGYDKWLAEFQATAKTGLDPLRKKFKEAPAAFRDYLTKHDGANYDIAKADGFNFDKAKADAETAAKNQQQAVPA
jgi:hypothetical protein